MKKDAPLMVACPACGRKLAYDRSNPWRPFCSERCKTTDLGAWASGAYVIQGGPSEEEPPEEGDSGPDAPRRND
jgi:endogenous inhibitor of DNA gyrase (YacG/DUF329 family)